MEKVRLGMIGIGSMGGQVAGYIARDLHCPNIALTAVCDNNPDRLAWAEKYYADHGITFFADAKEMMESGLVDAVYIATPHYDHPVLAMQAFGYGLHVMIEKPAGVYTKQVRQMNEAAEKAGVKFGIMFQTRIQPEYQKIKELLDSGSFGQIRSVNWLATRWYRSQQYYDSGSWRATWAGEGGGVLLNQCPHNLDVMQWLCGMPVEIRATCSVAQWHDVEIEDDVVATFKYPNGALGSFIATTGVNPGTNRLEIATDKGTIILDNGKLTINELDKMLQEYAHQGSQAPKVTKMTFEFTKETKPGHAVVLNAFADAILFGTPLIIDGYEGIKSLTLSNGMYLSDWIGQTVKLPLDEELFLKELNKRIATSKHKQVKASFADPTQLYQKR